MHHKIFKEKTRATLNKRKSWSTHGLSWAGLSEGDLAKTHGRWAHWIKPNFFFLKKNSRKILFFFLNLGFFVNLRCFFFPWKIEFLHQINPTGPGNPTRQAGLQNNGFLVLILLKIWQNWCHSKFLNPFFKGMYLWRRWQAYLFFVVGKLYRFRTLFSSTNVSERN